MRLVPFALDVVNQSYCTGWCYNRLFRSSPVTLTFYRGDQQVGKVTCDQPREDLKLLGLHPTGNCGFSVELDTPNDTNAEKPLLIKHNHGFFALVEIQPEKLPEPTRLSGQVFFMHIPKTAGTSFNQLIKPCLQRDDYLFDIQSIKDWDNANVETKPFLTGHIPFYRIREYFGQSDLPKLHSIVREPYAHLHSHLLWVKGVAGGGERQLFETHHDRAKNFSIKLNQIDFSDVEAFKEFVDALEGFELEYFDNLQTRYFLGSFVQRVSANDRQYAMTNLELFESVGRTENFPAFFQSLCNCYQIKQVIKETKYNKASLKPLFDINNQEFREVMHPLVKYDLEIYEKVKSNWG